MATTKRKRRGMANGVESIVLKDLQCLSKKAGGSFPMYKLEQGSVNQHLDDCPSLFCDETLDDLESVWASPAKPTRAAECPSAKTQRKSTKIVTVISPASSRSAAPLKLSACPKATSTGRTCSNPYITFLINSWDRASHPKNQATAREEHEDSPGHVSQVNSTTSVAALQEPEEEDGGLTPVNPDDVLVIPDNTREQFHAGDTTLLSRVQREEEQRVPEEGPVTEEHNQMTDRRGLDEESLFIEDAFLSPGPCQQVVCRLDHVVPDFELEE